MSQCCSVSVNVDVLLALFVTRGNGSLGRFAAVPEALEAHGNVSHACDATNGEARSI